MRAALLQGRPALEAWEEWKAEANIAHLDAGSYRLLPLLYWALRRQGVNEPVLRIFRGVYRRVWYENQLLFHRLAELLRSFRDAGIEAMVLKGAALAVLYYKDCSLRPMDDVDLFVSPRAIASAIGLVKAAGFAPLDGVPPPHAHMFQEAGGREIDIHWRVLPYNPPRVPDDPFWDAAVPIEIHGVSAWALNASDQLLHVCAHGASWNAMPTFRWVADAMTILTVAESAVDWNRLCSQARLRRLTLPLQDTLGYLKDVFAAPIPETVLQTLRRERTSMSERIAYAASIRSHELRGPWWSLYETYQGHCARLPEDMSVLRRFVKFPHFLQRAWGTDHLWQLPMVAGVKGRRWMERVLTRYRNQWAPPRA